MDSKRIDSQTRTRAAIANRRWLIGWSLTGGLAALVSQVQPARAQFEGGASRIYSVTLTSSVTAGATVTGALVIDVGDQGAIETGSLTLGSQAVAPVLGQAAGPAIDLLASLADGSTCGQAFDGQIAPGGETSRILTGAGHGSSRFP